MGTIVIGIVSGSVDAMCGCVSNMRTVVRVKVKRCLSLGLRNGVSVGSWCDGI